MRNIKFQWLGLCGVAMLVLNGCAALNHPSVTYVPEPSVATEAPLVDLLLVEKIVNAQPHGETLRFNPNNDPWILMPLCFYSSQKVNPMVKRNYFQNDLEEALQRLFLKDLKASNVAENIKNACKVSTTKSEWHKGYRLELILKHAVWNRNLTAYGLSYPGTILWSVGLPVSYGSVDLEVEAVLYPPGLASKPIAKSVLTQKKSCVEFIYDQIGYQPSVSENALTDLFPKIAKDLRKFLRKNLKNKRK